MAADQTVSLQLDADASGLKSEVQESGAAMEELASTSTAAGQEIESSVTGATSAWEDHKGVIDGVAVGAAALGAAFEGLARSQQDNRAVAGRVANALEGETTDSVMGLAAEIHDATTDLDNLVHSMEVGRQQGIASGEQLQEFAQFWDMVGDATGESDAALADASVALRAVGVAAGEESEALGAFGFIAQETTGSVGEFLQFLERTGPELRELGADIDDAAAILGILEQEFGMSGRVARTEFREAVNESDGTLQGLVETLGISTGQFETYRGEVSESSGVIEANAEAFGESRTAVQRLTAEFEGFMAQHSGVIDGLSNLAPILMGAGGAVFAINQMVEAKARLGVQAGRIAGTLGRGGIVVAAFAATALAARRLGEDLRHALRGAPAEIDELTLALEGLGVSGEIPESVGLSVDGMVEALGRVGDPGALERVNDALLKLSPASGSGDDARESVEALDQALSDMVQSGNAEAAEASLEVLAGALEDAGVPVEVLEELLPRYAQALEGADLAQQRTGDGADDLGGAFDDLEGEIEDARSAMERYLDDVRAAEDPVFALDRALRGVEDAQDSYNEAVKEHGPASEEAQRASLDLMSALSDMEAAAIDGDLSFAEFEGRLARWVDQGQLTEEQAAAIRDRVDEARESAEDYQGQYDAHFDADTARAEQQIDKMASRADEAARQRTIRFVAEYLPPADAGFQGLRGRATARADGGPLGAGELALVGERGPEFVVFGEPSHVIDDATTAELASMISGGARGGDGAQAGGFTYAPTFNTMPTAEEHREAMVRAEIAAARMR